MLVVYYSATGNTESVANDIAAALDADMFELEPVDPYTEEDLNWTDDNSRVVAEYENEDERDVELGRDRYRVHRISDLVGHCRMAGESVY